MEQGAALTSTNVSLSCEKRSFVLCVANAIMLYLGAACMEENRDVF